MWALQATVRFFTSRGAVLLLGFVLVTVALGSGSLLTYGFSDDYSTLSQANSGGLRGFDVQLVSYGRPVYALFVHLGFGSIDSISDLRWLRLVSLVGMGVLAWMFYCVLARAGIGLGAALTIPLIVCTMPAFELWGSWAVCFIFSWGAVLAVGAALTLDRALAADLPRRRRVLRGVGASALLIGSVLIYQPSCMVFVAAAGVFVLATARDHGVKATARVFLSFVVATVAAIGIDAIIAKTLPRLLYRDQLNDDRTKIATNVVDKIHWFVVQPLRDSLNLWNLTPYTWAGALVAIVIAAGLYLFVSGTAKERFLKLLLIAALLPVSYLPNLVTAQDFASYRTQAGLVSLVAVYLGLAVVAICRGTVAAGTHRRVQRPATPAVAVAVLGLLCLVGFADQVYNVSQYMVVPQRKELADIRSQLKPAALANATGVYVIPCDTSTMLASVHRYDEFGAASCGNTWSPGPMTQLAIEQVAPAYAKLPIVVASSPETANPPARSVVVDMRHSS